MHEGHRQRLLGRLNSGDNLYEHELLEILLFNAYPRRDVNPIAHALLDRFACIKEVLSADTEELCMVDGVGESVALYLKCIGRCLQASNNCDSFAIIKSTAQFKEFITPRFRGKVVEELEIYLLDKAGRVKRIAHYTSCDSQRVTVTPEEVLKLISVHKPYGIFVAHNHVNCGSRPSVADDELTKQIQIICSLNNTCFYDHCIYADGDDIYSYFVTDRTDGIKENYNINYLIKNGK
jgi:DNA repair protein RadC